MSIVYIKGLRAQAIIGIHAWERETRQSLVIDLEMASDTRRAAARDKIAFALDYAEVSRCVIALVEGSQYQLIETLAETLAAMITRDFGVQWLRLRLSKPGAVAEADDVGVIVERGERT
jgi:dihydroneopterin aldolase